jgi:hypothetical protein
MLESPPSGKTTLHSWLRLGSMRSTWLRDPEVITDIVSGSATWDMYPMM